MLAAKAGWACTNFLAGKGATVDGSTLVTYAADSYSLYGALYHYPAATYPPGTMLDIHEWDTGEYLGQIAQAERTYSVIGNMNEHQLCIGETTFGGRPELVDTTGIMDYGSLHLTQDRDLDFPLLVDPKAHCLLYRRRFRTSQHLAVGKQLQQLSIFAAYRNQQLVIGDYLQLIILRNGLRRFGQLIGTLQINHFLRRDTRYQSYKYHAH